MTTVRLVAGDDTITVDPMAGGRLVSARLGGRERLITTPPEGVDPAVAHVQWGAFVMAPWAGRIARGHLDFEGTTHRFPPDIGDHALHGVAHRVAWDVVESAWDRAVLACDLGVAGWPFGGVVEHHLSLDPGRLHLRLRVVAGDAAMPVWAGWHPCFRRPDDGDMRLRLAAEHVLATDDSIPTGHRLPVEGDTDLRQGPWLGERRLDHAFVDVTPPAHLAWPDLDLQVDVDDAIRSVVVFTPAHEVGVEPQTGWPDALALQQRGIAGTGARRLAPGEALDTTMTWTWRRRQTRP